MKQRGRADAELLRCDKYARFRHAKPLELFWRRCKPSVRNPVDYFRHQPQSFDDRGLAPVIRPHDHRQWPKTDCVVGKTTKVLKMK